MYQTEDHRIKNKLGITPAHAEAPPNTPRKGKKRTKSAFFTGGESALAAVHDAFTGGSPRKEQGPKTKARRPKSGRPQGEVELVELL